MDQLTPKEIEDRKIFTECNNEAFWRRGLPIGVLTGTILYPAIYYRRILTSYYKYKVPITLLGAFVGKVIGELTYAPICVERLQEAKRISN